MAKQQPGEHRTHAGKLCLLGIVVLSGRLRTLQHSSYDITTGRGEVTRGTSRLQRLNAEHEHGLRQDKKQRAFDIVKEPIKLRRGARRGDAFFVAFAVVGSVGPSVSLVRSVGRSLVRMVARLSTACSVGRSKGRGSSKNDRAGRLFYPRLF